MREPALKMVANNNISPREEIEIDLLCEAIYRHYGFDFREYARASLRRRIHNLMALEKLDTVSAVQDAVLHDKRVMERFLLNLSINVTSMFRDPELYLAIRKKVIPLLKTYPFIRIWHAGCSSGEEVYSMAILLAEEGLADKVKLYATDMNEAIVQKAKDGIFKMERMQEYTSNYIKAGGTRSFSEYYTAKYDHVMMRPELKENIIFSKHNLATDQSFNEFNVIFCRNVMIYFNDDLQNRVHQLMSDSLCRFGMLILGTKESVDFTSHEAEYKTLDRPTKIYQRVA